MAGAGARQLRRQARGSARRRGREGVLRLPAPRHGVDLAHVDAEGARDLLEGAARLERRAQRGRRAPDWPRGRSAPRRPVGADQAVEQGAPRASGSWLQFIGSTPAVRSPGRDAAATIIARPLRGALESAAGLPAAMGRYSTLRLIEALDPETQFWRIYRLHALQEFPWDVTRALELALYRTYAVPSIGELLDRTGEFRERTQKRYDDTALLLGEVLEHGFDAPPQPGGAASHQPRARALADLARRLALRPGRDARHVDPLGGAVRLAPGRPERAPRGLPVLPRGRRADGGEGLAGRLRRGGGLRRCARGRALRPHRGRSRERPRPPATSSPAGSRAPSRRSPGWA